VKPRFMIVIVIILALAVPAMMLAQGGRAEKEKEVRAVIDEFQKAVLKGGVEAAATLDKYNADDFTLIQVNGAVQTKAGKLGFRRWISLMSKCVSMGTRQWLPALRST